MSENINSILSGSGTSNLEQSDVRHIASADWDGDGVPDLALASDATIEFWRNLSQETGGWQPCISVVAFNGAGHISDLAFADGNRDGRPDLVVGIYGLEDQVWANQYDPEVGCAQSSHSQFVQLDYDETFPPGLPADTTHISVADFDNDNWLDLAVGAWESPSYLLRNRGNSYVERRFDSPIEMEVGDSNQVNDLAWGRHSFAADDDRMDLAIAHEEGLAVYSFALSGLFLAWEWPALNTPVAQVAWADLDGDAMQDLAFTAAVGTDMSLGVFLSESLESPGPVIPDLSASLGALNSVLGLALADDNLDGLLDTVVLRAGSDAQLLLGTEVALQLDENRSLQTGGGSDLVWLDAGGDGALDLLVSDQDSGEVAWELTSTRDGPLEYASFPQTESLKQYYSLAVADYDRDGDLDLAVGSEEGCPAPCNTRQARRLHRRITLEPVSCPLPPIVERLPWGPYLQATMRAT